MRDSAYSFTLGTWKPRSIRERGLGRYPNCYDVEVFTRSTVVKIHQPYYRSTPTDEMNCDVLIGFVSEIEDRTVGVGPFQGYGTVYLHTFWI